MSAAVVQWLSPDEAARLGSAAGRTLDRDLFRDLAQAVSSDVKAATRKAATLRLRRYLAVADGCDPKGKTK